MNGISSNSIGKSLLSGVDFKIEIVVYRNLKFSSQFKVSVLLYENIFYQKKEEKVLYLKVLHAIRIVSGWLVYKNLKVFHTVGIVSEWMRCVQVYENVVIFIFIFYF